jgi:glycine reductase
LGKEGEVVATLICGDNYFAENIEVVSEKIAKMIGPYKPDVLIAGPAFHAGRYGMACGAVCKAVQDHLGVPAVTGMYQENPGLEIYRNDVYIVPTADSARGMGEAIPKIVTLARKLAAKEKIGRPSEDIFQEPADQRDGRQDRGGAGGGYVAVQASGKTI